MRKAKLHLQRSIQPKSTDYSARGPQFNYQQSYVGSQPSIVGLDQFPATASWLTTLFSEDQMLSSGIKLIEHSYTQMPIMPKLRKKLIKICTKYLC